MKDMKDMTDEQSRKKVLIIEDEASLLGALKDKFHKEGFETSDARDGETGLKLALEQHPDAILLDLLLPQMDGGVVLKKLRQDKWGKNVPVIVLTNVDRDDKLMREVLEHKPCFYLIKTDWKLLEHVVRKVKEVVQ